MGRSIRAESPFVLPLPTHIVTARLKAPSGWCCSPALQAGEEEGTLLGDLQLILPCPAGTWLCPAGQPSLCVWEEQ